MLGPLLRLVAAPLAIAASVMLTGLPDFTALERAVSKAFASAEVSGDSQREPPLTVLAPSPIVVDGVPVVHARPQVPSPGTRLEPRRVQGRFGERPGDGLLVPLYSSFVALQALDVHSTLRAIDRGGVEVNPVMAPFTERPAAFVALKAGSTAGILFLTERVRRRSPTAAIIMMTAFNSAYAMVVANNYRLGNRLR